MTEAPSNTLSRATEARSGEKGSFSERARRAGRRISPTLPGRLLAAKPAAVARKAGKKRRGATGLRIQVQRRARKRNVTMPSPRPLANHAGEACSTTALV